jgi:hypothetical protein
MCWGYISTLTSLVPLFEIIDGNPKVEEVVFLMIVPTRGNTYGRAKRLRSTALEIISAILVRLAYSSPSVSIPPKYLKDPRLEYGNLRIREQNICEGHGWYEEDN